MAVATRDRLRHQDLDPESGRREFLPAACFRLLPATSGRQWPIPLGVATPSFLSLTGRDTIWTDRIVV